MISTPVDKQLSGRQYLTPESVLSDSPNQNIFPLTARSNDRDRLEIGGCDVVTLVDRFGSPLYILDEATIRAACRAYRQAFDRYYDGETQVMYASKAWSTLAICAIVASEGLGVDVASGGELYTALQANVAPETIYFHGNNKSAGELQFAIETGVTIAVDNWLELETLAELAAGSANPVRIAIRFTPGIECHTHEYIRTGHIDSKFGFDSDRLDAVFEFIAARSHLHCVGLHAHIGSQIFERDPHRDLGKVLVEKWQRATAKGLKLRELNVGGGLGIRYTEADDPPSIDEWAKAVCEGVTTACESAGIALPRLLCEPGRSIVGPAGITVYTLGAEKTIPGIRTYLSIDGGMSDNPRPALYQSQYCAIVANCTSAPLTETVTIAGKHCESGDLLLKGARLPKTKPGDVLAIASTGAYNASMASNYNRLPRPAAVLVNDGQASTIVRRETYADLVRCDRLPVSIAPEHP